jgi:lipoate-protein ligase A
MLHAGWPAVDDRPDLPTIGLCRVRDTAVVLGSTQSDHVVDPVRASGAGIAVARRRSGGGAVLVSPDDPVWIDAWVPAGHPLWKPDVTRAFDWLGDWWVRALASVGVTGISAHRQGYVACTRWSSLVCFGGVGTGEVVTADGRKVVGLAQRRDRRGAWFHGACVLHWDPRPLVQVLSLPAEEREAAVNGLALTVIGVSDLARKGAAARIGASGAPPVVDRESVTVAMIDALPPI